MPIEISNQSGKEVNEELIKNVSSKFLNVHDLQDRAVSIAFINDDEMRELNRKHRHKDSPTDVLSFRQADADWPDDKSLGEVVINVDQIKRQAEELNHGYEYEFIFILVHGLLHLIGYDDKTDEQAEEMDEKGRQFIESNLNYTHG